MPADLVPTIPAAPLALAPTTTQATAVEQARAVAEVQAAVVVAQQCPRDLGRAHAEMLDTCSHTALAERAFYSVPNRGSGASVHLARELARIWGNLTYGVRELRRDDIEGMSEIEVYAWDQQANVRSSRTVQVPHARMTKKGRQALTDLGDIVNNNNNFGARQLRECIFSLIPPWFIREAENACRKTLEQGDGKSLPDRITDMVKAFAGRGIDQSRLEARLDKPRKTWDAADVAGLRVDWGSITNDGIDPDSIFPSPTITATDLTQTGLCTPEQQTTIGRLVRELGMTDPKAGLAYYADVIGHPTAATTDLTVAEAVKVIDALRADLTPQGDPS